METAISKRCAQEKKQLQKQLKNKQITQKVFSSKQRDIEKWVSHEKHEIRQKRAKVQDTCGDIGAYLQKIEKDKKIMMDHIGSSTSTPRKRSSSFVSESQDSLNIQKAKDQLRDIKDGRIGGQQPETKYINKKREYVRKLMKEKHSAIEKGVKDKIQNYESEMIDEMLQAAINLDVDAEIEKRVDIAR